MADNRDDPALEAFARAARRVPAYQTLLRENGISAAEIETAADFRRLPVLTKQTTFARFDLDALCLDGDLGRPGTVLTSSGHSGIFAFGLTDSAAMPGTVRWIDDALDALFAVRSQRTLLINCLPMGVKVPTEACALGETSVRPDMAIGLVRKFGRHFAQIVFVSDPAFFKHLLETGRGGGVAWHDFRIHAILGEETLAENLRRYLQAILGHEPKRPDLGVVLSSLGVAELGLNLFFEAPPLAPLVLLRRVLHEDVSLRQSVLGAMDWTPSLFTYDPQRIFVEFDEADRLILTTLHAHVRMPLIRYAPGDRGTPVHLPARLRPAFEAKGVAWDAIADIPIVAIHGRGDHASTQGIAVFPEAVKEGIYHDAELAPLTTGNFRLASGSAAVTIRIQLSRGVRADAEIEGRFRVALSRYVRAPMAVTCHAYEDFRGGMGLDYERKFSYVEAV